MSTATRTAPSPTAPPRWLLPATVAVVVAGALLRLWVAGAGWFYWDDLVLHALAAGHRWPDPGLLLHDHDGHLMPGGMALVWLAAHLAPLDFRLPLAQMFVLDLVAGAALARLTWVLTRGRPAGLVPLVAAAVVPLGLPAATWWAAALTALPLAAALAWAAGSAVLLARTGRRRQALGVVLATALGLCFVEKAVLVPFVAALVVAGWWWTAEPGSRPDARTVLTRSRGAIVGSALVLAVWALVYGLAIGGPRVDPPADVPVDAGAGVAALVDHTYRLAVVPALAGGPWSWERWHPGPPWASPGPAAVTAGLVVCAGVLAASLLTRRRTGPLWLVAALYPLVSVVAVVLVRSGPGTAAEIVQTLRYHHDAVVVLAAAGALALVAPRRTGPAPASPARAVPPRALVAAGLAVFVASSLVSTTAYRERWADQPSRDYLEPLLVGLRDHPGPLLDQEVPLEVLLPVVGPAHQLSGLLAGVPGTPEFGAWTRDPLLVDAGGGLHPAEVAWGRTTVEGPERGCGWRLPPGGVRIPLDGPLMERDWVLRLNTFAGAPATVSVQLDSGAAVDVPLRPGLDSVFVRLVGGGEGVTVGAATGADAAPADVCLGSGPVGVLAPR